MLFVLVACGSTVQDRSQLAQRQGNVPVDEFGNPIPGATGSPGGTFVPGQGGSTSGVGSNGYIPGTGVITPANKNGPGVTDDKIVIGEAYCDDQQAVARSLGFSQGASDERRAWEIVIEDTNKHGGIGGRKVVAVYHQLDCQNNDSISSTYEELCQDFTQDHKVFAVMGAQEDVPNYAPCILRSGAVIIDTNITDADKYFLAKYPYNLQAHSTAVDTVARLQVAAHKAQGYFNRVDPVNFPSVKVGILVYGTDGFKRTLQSALLPALRDVGINVPTNQIVEIAPVRRLSDLGKLTADISSAVLRFSSLKVSHVLFLQPRGTLTLFFLREAQSQGYFPRYGFNSQDAAQVVLDLAQAGGQRAVSPRNFVNSVGIGWDPVIDVPSEADDSPVPPERATCRKLLEKNGYDKFDDANATAIAYSACNGMSFLKLSVARAGAIVNQTTFLSAVNGLGGNAWRSTDRMGYSLFSPTKHDGNNQYRWFTFDESKEYFRWSSPIYTIGV